MRCFLGVPVQSILPTTAIRSDITQITGNDEQQYWRWIPEENLHLTLCFLGEISALQVNTLCAAIDNNWSNRELTMLSISSIEVFPAHGQQRYYVAKIDENAALQSLHGLLIQCLHLSGIKSDNRPYIPHITLARINKKARLTRHHSEQLFIACDYQFPVTQLQLFESQPTQCHPRYIPLSTFPI